MIKMTRKYLASWSKHWLLCTCNLKNTVFLTNSTGYNNKNSQLKKRIHGCDLECEFGQQVSANQTHRVNFKV